MVEIKKDQSKWVDGRGRGGARGSSGEEKLAGQ